MYFRIFFKQLMKNCFRQTKYQAVFLCNGCSSIRQFVKQSKLTKTFTRQNNILDKFAAFITSVNPANSTTYQLIIIYQCFAFPEDNLTLIYLAIGGPITKKQIVVNYRIYG